jgi:hypothetical protein
VLRVGKVGGRSVKLPVKTYRSGKRGGIKGSIVESNGESLFATRILHKLRMTDVW